MGGINQLAANRLARALRDAVHDAGVCRLVTIVVVSAGREVACLTTATRGQPGRVSQVRSIALATAEAGVDLACLPSDWAERQPKVDEEAPSLDGAVVIILNESRAQVGAVAVLGIKADVLYPVMRQVVESKGYAVLPIVPIS